MAPEDPFAAQHRQSHALHAEAGAGLPGEVSLLLAQLNGQTAELRGSRRGRTGVLAYLVLPICIALLYAAAKSWPTTKWEAVIAHAMPVRAKIDRAAPRQGNASGLVLNATCIAGDRRLAIINGRVYKEKETLDEPGVVPAPCVVAEIFADKVLLECRGLRMSLCYSDTAAPAPNADRPDRAALLPPGLTPAAGAAPWNLQFDQTQQGVAGLEAVLSAVAGTKD